jgi:hypothetical protein
MNFLNVKYPISPPDQRAGNKKSERSCSLFDLFNTLLFVIPYFLFSCFFVKLYLCNKISYGGLGVITGIIKH